MNGSSMRWFGVQWAGVVLVCWASCALAMGADPNIHSVGPVDHIGAFDRHQWLVDAASAGVNPFDPDQIAVDATFTAPDGRKLVLPAFWDEHGTATAGDATAAPATGGFVIRFAPDQPGHWSMVVTARDSTGTRTSAPINFAVAASHRPGFIRRAANNRYLRYDSGASYFAVGINLCWPAGATLASWYDGAFATLAKNGGNFARVWMCHPPVILETSDTGLGKYSSDHAAYFDHLLDAADRNGIAVMLCFLNHREFLGSDMWGKAGWDTNPYNAAGGGPATRPVDFFTNADARRHFRARLRYIVARYAAYTSVGFWELFNEQENTGFPVPNGWNAEMAAYLRQIDPYQHLITTSAAVPAQVWALPEMDLTQTHIYGDGSVSQTLDSILSAVQSSERYHKPHLVGEMGLDYKGPDITFDPTGLGTAFHNSLWGGALSGNAGTAMYWWWDNYVEPKNLWHELRPISTFVRQIDWAHSNLRPLAIDQLWHADAGNSGVDLTLPTVGGWGDTNHGTIQISPTGTANAAPAHYLYGPQHPQQRAPLVFDLNVPAGGAVKIGVAGVSDCAFVRVSVDGKPVRDFPLSALPGSADISNPTYRAQDKIYQSDVNKEYSLDLPTGEHKIAIDVPAGDWVSLSHITFTRALPARYANLASAAVQDADSHQTLVWILDTRSNWQHDQAEPNLPVQRDVRLIVPHLEDGKYLAEWFDTRAGRIVRSDTVPPGTSTLGAPPFARDIAVRVRRDPKQ